MQRIWQLLFKGISNFRLIAAPRYFFKALKTKHCFGFETELSDGSFLTTSNAQSAAKISRPSTIDSEFHLYNTDMQFVLDRHKERLRLHLQNNPGLRTLNPESLDDVLKMQARLKAQKNAHRETVKWISHSELRAISSNPEVADAIYAAVRKLLWEEACKSDKTTKPAPAEADNI